VLSYTNEFVKPLTKGSQKMAYKITDDCISCGACEPECPEAAITAGPDKYVIDPDKCKDCGACADVCPTGAAQPA
jgi:ferredoxin